MPTTSSPWASPSSPAGRRLLEAEPATLDDIPVLDAATFARGAQLAAVTDARLAPCATAAGPVAAGVAGIAGGAHHAVHRLGGSPARRGRHARRATVVVRGVAAVALAVGVLAAGATGGSSAPTSAPAPAVAASPTSWELGRAAGAALGAATPGEVAAGDVVIGLIEPTEVLTATPGPSGPTAAERLGLRIALVASSV